MSRRLTSFGRYAAGFVTIVLITLFFRQETSFAITTVVLANLLAILVASTFWGLGVSVFMSITATLALDYYFFPPIGYFTISDPQDWVSLFAFLITSVIGSDLSARARRQAEESNRRRNEVEQLYRFSSHLLRARDPHELLNEIPKQIVDSFKARAAALCLPDKQEVYRSGVEVPQLDAIRLKATAAREDVDLDRPQGVYFAPVRLG